MGYIRLFSPSKTGLKPTFTQNGKKRLEIHPKGSYKPKIVQNGLTFVRTDGRTDGHFEDLAQLEVENSGKHAFLATFYQLLSTFLKAHSDHSVKMSTSGKITLLALNSPQILYLSYKWAR